MSNIVPIDDSKYPQETQDHCGNIVSELMANKKLVSSDFGAIEALYNAHRHMTNLDKALSGIDPAEDPIGYGKVFRLYDASQKAYIVLMKELGLTPKARNVMENGKLPDNGHENSIKAKKADFA